MIDDETDVLEYAQPELDAYFQTGLLDAWMLDRYDDADDDGLGQVRIIDNDILSSSSSSSSSQRSNGDGLSIVYVDQ